MPTRIKGLLCAGLLAIAAGLGVLPCLPALRGFCVPLYLLASTGIGAGFALVAISGKTILQERSPDAMRGRVLSSQLFLSSVVSMLPLPLMGKLADVVGFQRAFAWLAFIVLIIGIASRLHLPQRLSRSNPRDKGERSSQKETSDDAIVGSLCPGTDHCGLVW